MTTPTLFDPKDRQSVIARIGRLRADTRPQWGKMNAAQMLAHCQVPLKVATGEHRLRRGLIGVLFGRLALKKLMSPKGFGKNLPTHPDFRVADEREFEHEKDGLVRRIEAFGAGGPGVLTPDPHPFFGPMTQHQWETLMWKHLDHHLLQFGA